MHSRLSLRRRLPMGYGGPTIDAQGNTGVLRTVSLQGKRLSLCPKYGWSPFSACSCQQHFLIRRRLQTVNGREIPLQIVGLKPNAPVDDRPALHLDFRYAPVGGKRASVSPTTRTRASSAPTADFITTTAADASMTSTLEFGETSRQLATKVPSSSGFWMPAYPS